MSPDDGSDEPGTGDVPVEGASTTPVHWDPPGWSGFPDEPWATTQVPPHEWAAPEPPRRVWLRRTLVSLVVLLTVTGLVLGSLAYLDHRQEVKERKAEAARVAAEKKAAAAYVAAVKPLALKVFDAVQPIQDVYDSAGHRRPGYESARDDVIRHGGALRDLKAVKLALARLHAPQTYRSDEASMRSNVDSLIAAVTALEGSSHEKGNSHGIITSFGPNFQALQGAEILWGSAVEGLDKQRTWPLPGEDRRYARGRKVATVGAFIAGSDFACGKAWAALEFEDFKHPSKLIRTTYPKISREFRTLSTSLRAVPYPVRQRPLRHRLELGWSIAQDVAKQMDAVTAAYKRSDYTAFKRSFRRLEQAMDGLNDLALAYRSVGVQECTSLFLVDDDKGSTSKSA